ncbi:hypothetical protein CLAIMM_08875, partial [Cladophialophora immunda]
QRRLFSYPWEPPHTHNPNRARCGRCEAATEPQRDLLAARVQRRLVWSNQCPSPRGRGEYAWMPMGRTSLARTWTGSRNVPRGAGDEQAPMYQQRRPLLLLLLPVRGSRRRETARSISGHPLGSPPGKTVTKKMLFRWVVADDASGSDHGRDHEKR